MSDAFDRALAFTLRQEGGLSDNPADPGGRTAFGISERYHPEAWRDGNVTLADAKAIYRADYWDPARCDTLPEPLALALFDCAVNPGLTRAVQFLQAVLGTRADGQFGVVTTVKLRSADPLVTALRVADLRSGYWIARAVGEKVVFREGWLNRSRALREEILKGG